MGGKGREIHGDVVFFCCTAVAAVAATLQVVGRDIEQRCDPSVSLPVCPMPIAQNGAFRVMVTIEH